MSVRAEPGKTYPIRLLHMTNGMLLIGFVIAVYPETILLLRPHFVKLDFNPETENIDGYEFEPYLDQLVFYNPNSLDPTPFICTNVISVSVPANHLVTNFESVTMIKSMVAVDPEKVQAKARHFPSRNPVN